MPPRPPRRPTTSHLDPCRTTATPRRRSQARSSKPSPVERGSSIRPVSSRIAPCGGARPRGSRSRTGSSTVRRPKRFTSAGIRSAKAPLRTGPVTTTAARPVSPAKGRRALRSRSSRRAPPHHQPARSSAPATAAGRRSGPRTAAPATMAQAATGSNHEVGRTTFAAASPAQSAAAARCGCRPRSAPLTASRAPGAAPAAPGRSRERRRDRPPSGRARSARGTGGSAGR